MKKRLNLQDFISYVREGKKVKLSKRDKELVELSRKRFEETIAKQPVYGVNTGVGAFFDKPIPVEKQEEFQKNLIRSHACGTGDPLPKEVARGMMLLLINSLKKGYSGIRWETIKLLAEMLNKDVIPIIPQNGSVGASGDLIPLAHLALVLGGEGYVWLSDGISTNEVHAGRALEKVGLKPITLKNGEAIAIINGTHLMESFLAISAYDALNLLEIADLCAAMTIAALSGKTEPFDERIHELRPHQGQIDSAKNLRKFLAKNIIFAGEAKNGNSGVQDAYSLRCVPQVHGASRDSVNFAKKIAEKEMNSITSNPIFLPSGEVICQGNFHGQPLAQAADLLSIALSTLANISFSRIEKLLNSKKLPLFLTEKGGTNSGLMMVQYLAADLVSQNKTLSHPASVDSMPVSAGQEDFVSMGAWAAKKARQVYENAENVLAIEFICASQAIDLQKIDDFPKIQKAQRIIRRFILRLEEDRPPSRDIKILSELIRQSTILKELEKD